MPDSSSAVRPLSRARAEEIVTTLGVPEPFDERLVLLSEPRSSRADAFRLARHRLAQRHDPRLLLVTSAAPGEGKSKLAANLALCIAEERGPSVVLLDAHRARPALARMFGIPPERDVVAAARSHEYSLQRVAGSELLVALAQGSGDPISQVEREALRVALTDLRLAHDYVILDAGPALAGLDVHWMAELVDGVIFAVRAGVTERRSLRRALEGLMPVPLAGAVLMD